MSEATVRPLGTPASAFLRTPQQPGKVIADSATYDSCRRCRSKLVPTNRGDTSRGPPLTMAHEEVWRL
jgi:hypothetical protein